jgi:hypothetical protein
MTMSHPPYAGMTVNERLFWADLLDKWDSAIRAGDRQAAIDVLSEVELGSQADRIVDTTLANPTKYGF